MMVPRARTRVKESCVRRSGFVRTGADRADWSGSCGLERTTEDVTWTDEDGIGTVWSLWTWRTAQSRRRTGVAGSAYRAGSSRARSQGWGSRLLGFARQARSFALLHPLRPLQLRMCGRGAWRPFRAPAAGVAGTHARGAMAGGRVRAQTCPSRARAWALAGRRTWPRCTCRRSFCFLCLAHVLLVGRCICDLVVLGRT